METDGEPPRLLFRLFGAFEARIDGQPLEGLNRRKGERVLAYLILHAGQWVERESLADDLWDEEFINDPESNLRQSLAFLRQRLGQDASCLEFRAGAIRLTLRKEQADTLQFEAACKRDDRASLAQARKLLEDPLLAGWGDNWVCRFRERFAQKLENAGQRLQAQSQSAAFPTSLPPDIPSVPHLESEHGQEAVPQGGAVPLGSSYYVTRPADAAVCAALARQESIVLIKGARQVGKSSLLARGLQSVHGRGGYVCHTDFEQIGPDDMASRDAFYLRLAASLAERCGLEFAPETDWKTHMGANGNLERFLRRRLLAGTEGPLLWALDGADRLFQTGYYAEFFALLRGLHTKRATEPDIPWSRLT
ncbi:MAG TPA: AAA-like domain-containing protein, partial [Chthonomonadaceae bacterium]|nr:AAA-like domain-containing protein [Chthonomonadaceae bacterium]